jgi:hypothetical protein
MHENEPEFKSGGILMKISIPVIIAALPLTSSVFAMADTGADEIQEFLPEPCSFFSSVYASLVPFTSETADNSLHRGWPVNLNSPGAGFPYTPTLFDIDGDGAEEIFLMGGETFGLKGDGSFLPGWPTSEMAYMGYGTNAQMPGPSCADVDGNSSVEIMWSERDWYAGSAHMWTFNGRNSSGSNMAGFPMTAPDEPSNALNSPFVLGDADGDGNLEACTAHTLGNTGDYYRISGMDYLGNLLFTTDLDPVEDILNLYFGDADGNGEEEFFAVTLLNGSFYLHLFTSSGAEQAGYPVSIFTPGGGYLMFGPPIPADLDGNGDLEIIMGYTLGSTSIASASHHDGTAVSGFPITINSGSQLLYLGMGDVTSDGNPELIAIDNELSADYRITVIDMSTGSTLPGWPVSIPNWPGGFPAVVDVDNDGFQDICVVTDGGLLYAISNEGTTLSGYPKALNNASISGVAAGDTDGDGYYELVAATWDGFVYAWDTLGMVAPGRADWPMRGVDARNTGIFTGSQVSGISEEEQPLTLSLSSNPVSGSAVFIVDGTACPFLYIYDITGKQIAEISSGGSSYISWAPQEAIPAGIYFAGFPGESGNTLKFAIVR